MLDIIPSETCVPGRKIYISLSVVMLFAAVSIDGTTVRFESQHPLAGASVTNAAFAHHPSPSFLGPAATNSRSPWQISIVSLRSN